MVTADSIRARRTILYGATGSSAPSPVDVNAPQTGEAAALRLFVRNREPEQVYLFPAHLREAQRRVLSFAGRPQDWDGQGAAAVEASTIARANKTLWELSLRAAESDRLLPPPAVGVSPDGAIGFEWSTPEVYVAVECLGDSRSAYVRIEGKETERTVRSGSELWELIREALDLIGAQTPAVA